MLMPQLFDFDEVLLAATSEAVVAGPAIVLRRFPLSINEPVAFHAAESRVKRAFLNAQLILRGQENGAGNAVTVLGAACESF